MVAPLLICSLISSIVLLEGFAIAGTQGFLVAALIIASVSFALYWYADRIMLRLYAASEVSTEEAESVCLLVRQLFHRAGLPMPRVYISKDPSPLAFVAGRNITRASLTLTEALLKSASPVELSKVIAHELEDLQHRDNRFSMVISTIAVAFIQLASLALWRSHADVSRKRSNRLRCDSVGCTGLPA